MFIVNITYKVPLEKVEEHLEAHIDFLNAQYAKGTIQVSGKKQPRTGGILLSTLADKAQLENILAQDPFKQHNLADFEIIEFLLSKAAPEFSFLL